MDTSDIIMKAGSVATGVFVGGGLLIWFAKMMAARLIKQYDDKHAEHEKRLRELSERLTEHLTDLKIKLARLEPLVAAATTLKDDLKTVQDNVAVLKHVAGKTNADLNQAHNHIRTIQAKIL